MEVNQTRQSRAAAAHSLKVQTVVEQVKGFSVRQEKVRIYHGSTNSTRPFGSGPRHYVDASQLDQVIEINTTERYAIVEPNVPLDRLVAATLAHGLVPPMVAEFPGITVGGAVQGGSGESSSFRWGGFHDTCLEYEIVLGNGELVTASRTEHADLFWGMSCAYGSLGIMTQVKIQLVPTTKYVRVRYQATNGHAQAVRAVQAAAASNVDFVDGILFSPESGAVITGTYTNDKTLPVARFHRAIDDWFYTHAEAVSRKHAVYEELIPLRDYLFRYDRGGFWVAKYGFQHVPFNRFTRFLFAGLFKTRTLYKLLQGSNYAYRYLVQDICLPEDKVVSFLDFARRNYNVYPLWLCPLRVAGPDKLSPNALATKLVINVGIWGPMKPAAGSFVERNRRLEAKVHELGGRKVLYAHSYYTEEEFWQVYDKPSYTGLRRRYHATVIFPDVYAKTATKPPAFRPSKRRGLLALFWSPYRRSS